MPKELPKAWFQKSKKWPSYQKERAAYIASLPCSKHIQAILEKSKNWDMKRYDRELTKILKSYPKDPFVLTWQAAIYGDYGQCLGKKEKQFRATAAKRIRPLLTKLRNKPPFLQSLVRNEFFYHSYNYLKQYQLGIKNLRSGYNGHFSAGVGAAMHALEAASRSWWEILEG